MNLFEPTLLPDDPDLPVALRARLLQQQARMAGRPSLPTDFGPRYQPPIAQPEASDLAPQPVSPMQPSVQPDMLNQLAQIRGYDSAAVDPTQVASREANGANALIAALQGQRAQMVADHRTRMADRDMAAQGRMQAARDRYPNSMSYGSTYGDGADVARLAADAVIGSDSLPLGQKLDAGWALGSRRYPTSVEGAAADPASVRADLEQIVFDPRARQREMAQRGRYAIPTNGRSTVDGTEVSRSEIHPGGIRLEGPSGKYDDKKAYTKHLADRQKFQRDRLAQSRSDRAEENLQQRMLSRDPRIANQAMDLVERLKQGPSDANANVLGMMRQLQRLNVPPQAAAAIVSRLIDADADVQSTQIAADAKVKFADPDAKAADAKAKKNEAAAAGLAVEGSAPVIDATRFGKARDWRFPEFGGGQAAGSETAAVATPPADESGYIESGISGVKSAAGATVDAVGRGSIAARSMLPKNRLDASALAGWGAAALYPWAGLPAALWAYNTPKK